MEACYATLQNEEISLKRAAYKYLQLKGTGTGSPATLQNQHLQRVTNLAQVP